MGYFFRNNIDPETLFAQPAILHCRAAAPQPFGACAWAKASAGHLFFTAAVFAKRQQTQPATLHIAAFAAKGRARHVSQRRAEAYSLGLLLRVVPRRGASASSRSARRLKAWATSSMLVRNLLPSLQASMPAGFRCVHLSYALGGLRCGLLLQGF